MTRSVSTMQRWQGLALARVLAEYPARVCLLIIDDRPKESRPPGLDRTGGWVWRWYYKYWVLRFSIAYATEDFSYLWSGAQQLRIRDVHRPNEWTDVIGKEDLATISSYDLDVIFRFGFGIVRGDILDVPRHGIWSYHLGAPEFYRGGPPAFWEVFEGAATLSAILQRLTERLDAGHELARATIPRTSRGYVSQLDSVAFAAVPLLLAAMLGLNGPAVAHAQEDATLAPVYRAPTSLQFLAFLWKSLVRLFSLRSAHST